MDGMHELQPHAAVCCRCGTTIDDAETFVSPIPGRLQALREQGYRDEVVERGSPFAKVRRHVFRADVIGVKPGEPLLAIQATWKHLRA